MHGPNERVAMIDRETTGAGGVAVRASYADSAVSLVDAPASTLPPPSAATQRSTVDYLASAERTAVLAGLGWKACAALAVLVLAAWALGVLPAAARLF